MTIHLDLGSLDPRVADLLTLAHRIGVLPEIYRAVLQSAAAASVYPLDEAGLRRFTQLRDAQWLQAIEIGYREAREQQDADA